MEKIMYSFKKTILFIILACVFGVSNSYSQNAPRTDTFKTKDGSIVTFHFFGHASLAIESKGKLIYVDPVTQFADYEILKKADAILITHSHSDHFDLNAIKLLAKKGTKIFSDTLSSTKLSDYNYNIMKPEYSKVDILKGVRVEAIAAYNVSEGHTKFHPKKNKNCGYLLIIGDSRIYIAGDTEPTEEMKRLHNIDVAFLPVNQPYTMTVEQTVSVIKEMKPLRFYPYHYGQVQEKTDIQGLVNAVKGFTDVRLMNME